MKHNNQLPNAHFKKDWHFRVRVKLNQAARKAKRAHVRKVKAAAIAPRPAQGKLRPVVHSTTQRYNSKLREGRGFTLEEIKAAGVSKAEAIEKGIAVDYRRRNKSEESLKANAQRLKSYLERVVMNPKGEAVKQLMGTISKIDRSKPKIEGMIITKEMQAVSVVRVAKQAEATRKLEGKRRWVKKKGDEGAAAGGEAEAGDE